jgi:hypothetical protein
VVAETVRYGGQTYLTVATGHVTNFMVLIQFSIDLKGRNEFDSYQTSFLLFQTNFHSLLTPQIIFISQFMKINTSIEDSRMIMIG